MSIEDTLVERQQTHGDFNIQSYISQSLKSIAKQCEGSNWDELDCDMKESIDMILHKVARILAGNPNHIDSWHDIAGYSMLVEKRLTKELEKDILS